MPDHPIGAAPGDVERRDLTAAQTDMLIAQRAAPSSSVFVTGYVADFDLGTDPERLIRAIDTVLDRFQGARARFDVDADGRPFLTLTGDRPATRAVDLRSDGDPQGTAEGRAVERVNTVLDVATDPLLHSELLWLPDGYRWFLAAHHTILDGAGAIMLTDAVLEHYRGTGVTGTAPWDMAAVAADDAAYRRGPAFDADRRFWAERTSGMGRPLTLLPAITELAGRAHQFEAVVDDATARAVTALSAGLAVRPAHVLLAAYIAYVHRWTSESVITLSVPTAARATPVLRSTPAMVSTIHPLTVAVTPEDTLATLARRVHQHLDAARPHSRYRGEDMLRDLAATGDPARTFFGPGANILLSEPDSAASPRWSGRPVDVGPYRDLEFVLAALGPDTPWRLLMRGDAAAAPDIDAHGSTVLSFLERLSALPATPVGDMDLLSEPARETILRGFNDTACDMDRTPVTELFAAAAADAPHATAIVDGSRRLTYGTVAARVDELAGALLDAGLGREEVVALGMPRSAEMVIALLAVLRAGGAFVPLDPGWPDDRRAKVLADASTHRILGSPDWPVDLDDWRYHGHGQHIPAPPIAPDQLAYVIFTSGSTGRPKGAMIRHAAIAERLCWQIDHVLGFGAQDASLFKAPLAFDISINEILLPLVVGGRLVIAEPGGERDPRYLLDVIEAESVTFVYLVSSMLEALLHLDDTGRMTALRHVWCGGEVLTPRLFTRFRRALDTTLYHGYGPAEATIGVSHVIYRDAADRIATSIGSPNPNTCLYVLDSRLRPVPVGAAGELYAAGSLLGRGYSGAPALTATRFIADPFAADGSRMYRTGDRARWRGDGSLDFLGRADNQVKIRGMRLELEDVEVALSGHPDVRHAAVTVVSAHGVDSLAAYAVLDAGAGGELHPGFDTWMRKRLPDYMVPASLTVLDRFPLTTNGKLDRRSLPAPRMLPADRRAPRNDIERRLCAVFAAVLGTDEVGVTDDFFAAGGHSLMAFRLAVAIEADLGVDVSLNTLFTERTVARLAEVIDVGTTAGRLDPADIAPADAGPVSAGQQQLLLIGEISGPSTDYLLILDFELAGHLDESVLRRALGTVMTRHPVLRTVYPHGDNGWTQQVRSPEDVRAAVTVQTGMGPVTPIDLTTDFPIAVSIAAAGDPPRLRIVVHHIACDQVSVPVIVGDLAAAYTAIGRGDPIETAGPSADYLQFARWQQQLLGSADDPDSRLSRELDFWSRRLAGVEPITPLPHDFPRPDARSGGSGLTTIALSGDLLARMRALSGELSVTDLMMMHAAVAVALHAVGAGDTVPIGTAVDGRTHHQFADTVGYFVNTVVLSTRVDPDATFGTLVTQIRREDTEAYDHRSVPFEKVVERLSPPRPAGVNPLFQVMIAQFDDRPLTATFGDTAARSAVDDAAASAKFDLTFGIGRMPDGTHALSLVYDTDLFTEESAGRLLGAAYAVLAHGVRHPDRILLTPEPRTPSPVPDLPLSASQLQMLDAGLDPHAEVSATIPGAGPDVVYQLISRFEALRMVLVTDGPAPRLRVRDIADILAEDPFADAPVDLTHRGVAAGLTDGGVVLRVHPLLIDAEGLALLAGGDAAETPYAEYLRAGAESAADLGIVDAGEAWLDFGDEAAERLDALPRVLPAGAATGPQRLRRSVSRHPVPLDLGDTTTAALLALARALAAEHRDFAELVHVDEPDRDRRSGTVGRLRRAYPRLITAEAAGYGIADAAAVWRTGTPAPETFGIAGCLSPHTEGIFEDFPDPSLLLTVTHGPAVPIGMLPRRGLRAELILGADTVDLVVDGYGADAAAAVAGLADRWLAAVVEFLPELARPADPADLLPSLSDSEIQRLTDTFGPPRHVWPLSPLQTGLLFHLQAAEHSDVYLSQTVVELSGRLDRERLAAAAVTAAGKFPNVAVGFTELGDRTVQVVPDDIDIAWTYGPDTDLTEFTAAERSKPFAAHHPPLFRFGLCSDRPDHHHLVFTAEHILLDGWSIWRFLVSVLDAYTDPRLEAERTITPFSRYLTWLGHQDLADAHERWRDYLGGIDEPTLVAPREQSLGATSATESRNRIVELGAGLSERVAAAAERAGVTLSTVFETAWSLTLRQITGTDDVTFGSVVAGRPPEIDGIDTTIGLLFNTVPTRFILDRWHSVTEMLQDAQQRKLLHLTHPYVTLSELLQISGHRALFDTLFVFQNTPVLSPDKPYGPAGHQVYVADVTLQDATHYPVTVVVNPDAGSPDRPGIALRVMYQADVVPEDRLDGWLDTYVRVLESLAEDPEQPVAQCDPLSPDEREWVLRGVNRTRHHVPEVSVYDLLVEQTARSADLPAVRSGDTTLTYTDLVEAANRLGRLLLAHGAGPEARVALLLPRSEAMVIALFAVFAAHSAYVPIDPEHPADRIDTMITAAAPAVILTDTALAGRLPAHLRDDPRTLRLDALDGALAALSGSAVTDAERGTASSLDQLAYVIFTSGSTGTPKGVAVGYRGLTNMYYNHAEAIFTPVLRRHGGRRIAIAHTTSFSFDASWEQLLWLLAGHEVHVIDADMRRDPSRLLAYFDEHRIDAFDVTPSYGDLLLETGMLRRPRCTRPPGTPGDTGLVFVSLGGEAVGDRLWNALRDAPGVDGYNLYGPTEYTINALGADVADSAEPSVGRPIWNTRAYVLDSTLRPVGRGNTGELYLAGAGLARGYVGMAARTAERFVACPFDGRGERMYRTGDLVRRRPDGTLDYLGRADDQVKIRGHRIEPAEIANVLAAQPGVARCAVVAVTRGAGKELAAYVVPDGPRPAPGDLAGLRAALRMRLPSYMVPAAITTVTDLPLTVNGKLDARALPAPEWASGSDAPAQPTTALEEAICQVVGDVLGVADVGRDDDFFLIGGHSLLAVRLASRIGAVIGTSLSIRDIYQNPTPAGLAAASVTADDSGSMLSPVLTLRAAGTASVVCFQPAGGLAWSYMGLVRFLRGDESVYALQDPYLADATTELTTFDALVDDQYRRLTEAVPDGPYHLLGWSFGGQIAHEVAVRLRADGHDVCSLVLLDSFLVPTDAPGPDPAVTADFADHVRGDPFLSSLDRAVQDRLIATHRRHLGLTAAAQHSVYDGDALLICATDGLDPGLDRDRVAMWADRVGGELRVERVDLPHIALGQARGWDAIGSTVAGYLAR